MSSRAEDVVYLSLTDTDSLEALATIGLPEEAIPTEAMRPVVAWAIEQFFASGRTVAPSRDAMLQTWGEVIDDARVELLPEDEDADTVQWAIAELKSHYVHAQFEQWMRQAGSDMASVHSADRVKTLVEITDELFGLTLSVQPKHMQAEVSEGAAASIAAYEARARDGHQHRGMIFGLDAVDQHTYGIHPGEVCVLAAPTKTGKSWLINKAAIDNWEAGKRVVLFTLENSVEMTIDRIVCLHERINYRRYQRGECLPEELDSAKAFLERLSANDSGGHLEIIMPEPGQRTMASMVRQAQLLGAEVILIDQLTFVEHANPGRKARNELIRDMMHDLKTLVSTGAEPISAMIAHQINRDGIKGARKSGYLQMDDMAEGSEVERTADWVFGLYQSSEQRKVGQALLQVLATRREDLNQWEILWEPARGLVAVLQEASLD